MPAPSSSPASPAPSSDGRKVTPAAAARILAGVIAGVTGQPLRWYGPD